MKFMLFCDESTNIARFIRGVDMRVGFAGLGVMGVPIALNLARAGTDLVVWSRSGTHYQELQSASAKVASTFEDLCQRCEVIVLMLADASAMDQVLNRGTDAFPQLVQGKVIVNMGTTSAEYSAQLGVDIQASAGRYVEAPVSGSRQPAIDGQLVGMLAGEDDAVSIVRPILGPACRQIYECGPVPRALHMKLAVNLFLITMVAGLAESAHFAQRHGLDLSLFRSILDVGPMASSVSKIKLGKLVDGDFSVQASIQDVLKNNQLVAQAARLANLASPMLDTSHALFQEAVDLGFAREDMAAVVKAIEARTKLAWMVASSSAFDGP